jgi:hypothetical protein
MRYKSAFSRKVCEIYIEFFVKRTQVSLLKCYKYIFSLFLFQYQTLNFTLVKDKVVSVVYWFCRIRRNQTGLTMNEIGLSKRQETPPPSPRVAGANPRSTRSGKCTSVACSQGALVHQDTKKTKRELQKNPHVKQTCIVYCDLCVDRWKSVCS